LICSSVVRLVLGFAVLARLQIGCERLTAALHRPREVHRKGFRIELLLSLGFGRNVAHDGTLYVHFNFVTAQIAAERFQVNPDIKSAALRQSNLVLSY